MPTSPGPLYTSPTAPRTPKRSRRVPLSLSAACILILAAPLLVPWMILMSLKPIARAALATLAMAHRVLAVPVGPAAPPS